MKESWTTHRFQPEAFEADINNRAVAKGSSPGSNQSPTAPVYNLKHRSETELLQVWVRRDPAYSEPADVTGRCLYDSSHTGGSLSLSRSAQNWRCTTWPHQVHGSAPRVRNGGDRVECRSSDSDEYRFRLGCRVRSCLGSSQRDPIDGDYSDRRRRRAPQTLTFYRPELSVARRLRNPRVAAVRRRN